MAHIDKKLWLPESFRQEYKVLCQRGIKSSHAYEILARSYGYKTFASMRACACPKVGEPS